MTLPFERRNAISRTRDFLLDLLDPKETPRLPKQIRRQAQDLLRHFPSELHMCEKCNPCKEVEKRNPNDFIR